MIANDETTTRDTRLTRRFVFRRPCEASFGEVSITLIDLSRSGAQAMHHEPIAPGTESKMELAVPGAKTPVSLRARVVWSRRSESSGRQKIGFAITDERFDLAADLIDQMVRLRWVEVERRRERRPLAKTRATCAHAISQARRALAFLDNNTATAIRWKNLVAANATPTHRHPIEVLAAWELLGRTVDIDVVAQAHRERALFVLNGSDLLEEADENRFAVVE